METTRNKTDNQAGQPHVFSYLDYRKYLRDLCAARKRVNPHFSYRLLSEKVGIRSGGFLSWVLQGKRNISERLVFDIARYFKLGKNETVYFELLVSFNQASTHEARKNSFEKLLALRRGSVRQIETDQQEFYRKWYYTAVRELVAVLAVTDDNHAEAAARLSPPIKPSTFKKTLSLLERLGMIRKNEHGVYERTDAVISSKAHIPFVALHDFQIACMGLAKEAYDRFEKGERELSTVTVSIDNEAYLKIVERLAMFRAEVMEIARAVEKPTRVMQLNLQFFPLSAQRRHGSRDEQ